jgi:hypothetical protein
MSRKKERDERRREEYIERRRRTPPPRKRTQRSSSNISRSPSRIPSLPEEKKKEEPDETQIILSQIYSRLHSTRNEAENVTSQIHRTGNEITELEGRINDIRSKNYVYLPELEQEYTSLFEKWEGRRSGIEKEASVKVGSLIQRINQLENQLSPKSNYSELKNYESESQNLESYLNQARYLVNAQLQEFKEEEKRISDKLLEAETTVKNLVSSSIDWLVNENPVISVRAHDLNDDVHGVLTLTNMRILFEEEKEVVLERVLFLATEKKKVREVRLDKPIGAVDQMTKGKVGFFKGSGAYISFKPSVGLGELKFDLGNRDVESLVNYFSLISSGQLDKETEETMLEEGDKMIRCPFCNAPYSEEIYRGQTTLICMYCGTSFKP